MITFKKFIAESEAHMAQLCAMIESDCKPFLNESERTNLMVRGFSNMYQKDHARSKIQDPQDEEAYVNYWTLPVRKDRRPTNSGDKEFEMQNTFFKGKFGVNARAEALFCFPDTGAGRSSASSYGNVFVIFPIGDFKYLWSPKVRDLFVDSAPKHYEGGQEVADAHLESYAYENDDLPRALKTRNEIMVLCDKYYAIPATYSMSLRRGLGFPT